jgi:hypothetical protein
MLHTPDAGDVPIPLVAFAISLPVLTIMVVFAMRYGMLAFRARMQMAADARYRTLAEETAAAQTEMAASMAGVRAQLTAIAASLASVEKVLKQVG